MLCREAPESGNCGPAGPESGGKNAGAVAFSRTGDPNTGDFSDAVILATYGEVDRNMLGE